MSRRTQGTLYIPAIGRRCVVRDDALRAPLSDDEIAVVESPPTQEPIAGALGLTTVHVNRTLRALREADLLAMRGRMLRILDPGALAELAGFDPEIVLSRDVA